MFIVSKRQLVLIGYGYRGVQIGMGRFASFDEAVSVLEDHDRISVASLARALGASYAAAETLIGRLQEAGHVAADAQDGWYPVVGARSRRSWGERGGSTHTSLPGRIAALEAENATLRHRLREAEERIARLAQNAAPVVPAPPPASAELQKTRRRLRYMLARALHPDLAEGTPEERVIYGDLFKRLWPQLEAVIDGRDSNEDDG